MRNPKVLAKCAEFADMLNLPSAEFTLYHCTLHIGRVFDFS